MLRHAINQQREQILTHKNNSDTSILHFEGINLRTALHSLLLASEIYSNLSGYLFIIRLNCCPETVVV